MRNISFQDYIKDGEYNFKSKIIDLPLNNTDLI